MKKLAIYSFSLISSFLVSNVSDRSFRSNQMSVVSELLRSLTKNEKPWAIRSGRSEEMRDRERIAQVAHQKWANEWIAHFFEQIADSLIFGQKTSDSLGNQMSEFPTLQIRLKVVVDFADSAGKCWRPLTEFKGTWGKKVLGCSNIYLQKIKFVRKPYKPNHKESVLSHTKD